MIKQVFASLTPEEVSHRLHNSPGSDVDHAGRQSSGHLPPNEKDNTRTRRCPISISRRFSAFFPSITGIRRASVSTFFLDNPHKAGSQTEHIPTLARVAQRNHQMADAAHALSGPAGRKYALFERGTISSPFKLYLELIKECI